MDGIFEIIREDEAMRGSVAEKVRVTPELIKELADSDLPNSEFLPNADGHKYGYVIGNRVLAMRGYPRVSDCLVKLFEMLMDVPFDGFNAMDRIYEVFMCAGRAERASAMAANMRKAVEIRHSSLAPCYAEYVQGEGLKKSEFCDDELLAKLKNEIINRRDRFVKIKSFMPCDVAFYDGNIKFYDGLLAYLEEAEAK